MIDLKPRHADLVKEILQRHIADRGIWAFGSRIDGTAKEYSDLDLAILGSDPVPTRTLSALKEDFAKSDLPFQVDVVDWNRISLEFQRLIQIKYIPF